MKREDAKLIAEELSKIINVNSEQLLTAKELAEFLKVSEGYIRQHMDLFPYIKIGGNVRFPKSQVLSKLLV